MEKTALPIEKDTARKHLASLLDDFKLMRENGRVSDQAEATTRSWLEKLLEIFGWNPLDPHQVKQEYKTKGRGARRHAHEGTTHTKPDYTLVVNGQDVLFIDAKRFDTELKEDDSAAYQVRSYGWSAGLKLSYAFNFKELAIYDCRSIPKAEDDAEMARVFYVDWQNYLTEFDRLWEYLSRDAIAEGSISRLHPDEERPKGTLTLDRDFEEHLSAWRRELAKSILRYGRTRDPVILSSAAQRILDRIIFLRFCEEIGLEELGNLHNMAYHEDGFWPLFMEEHGKRYRKLYDGILFPRAEEDDPTGVDTHINQWWLKGRVFQQIVQGLYSPSPYRFDVIPIELLGGIYEKYLGKRLRVVGNDVTDEYKPEYQRTKGTVYTPPWVVARVVKNTLVSITRDLQPDALLELKILDPACGSGSFLLGAYDYLEQCLIDWFEVHPEDGRRPQMLIISDGEVRLQPRVVRHIIMNCLCGVDIDPEAVEVARMSLALRYVDKTARDQDEQPADLLVGIGANIKQGNSLVGPDFIGLGFNPDEVSRVMPFDWRHKTLGFGNVLARGGFDAVIGNPPYIEVKRYAEWMPPMARYLKESGVYQTMKSGKVDVSIAFIERSFSLLKPGGRLGFIIQNRFFKTEYGEIIRCWLASRKRLDTIEDFRDLQVFEGRTTYTAIVILGGISEEVRYRTYNSLESAKDERPALEVTMPRTEIDDGVWSFDQPDLNAVCKSLSAKHGTIGKHGEIQINVGLQTLYGKIYQIQPIAFHKMTIVGINGFGEEVKLERKALRPLCCNRGFYPFRRNNADAYVIFPYRIDEGEAIEIPWLEFEESFPKTASYLEERKTKIKNAVEVPHGPNRWHLYKYPKNLIEQTHPKVLFPSTIEDTVAAVDIEGNVYQDNVRINSLIFPGASDKSLIACAAIINSNVFNALAKHKAGLSESNWRQMNKQFLSLVPFPFKSLHDESICSRIAQVALKIQDLQEDFPKIKGEGQKQALFTSLSSLWDKLDEEVDCLYELKPDEKGVLSRYPRKVSRIDLFARQTALPEDDD